MLGAVIVIKILNAKKECVSNQRRCVYYELFSKFQTINSCSPLGIQASCDYIYIQVSNMRQCTFHYCTMGSEMYEVYYSRCFLNRE